MVPLSRTFVKVKTTFSMGFRVTREIMEDDMYGMLPKA